MKHIITLSIVILGLSFGACQSNTKKETAQAASQTSCTGDCTKCEKTAETKSVLSTAEAGVYYFHGDRKCKTCKAVGAKAKEVAESLNVKFFDINFDQEKNKALAKQFQASSSGLFIKSAKSDKIDDLTTFAFRNALNDTPAYIEKLHTVIKAELQ
nr:nitrophenyl compound nitroreductase subunit ArsF family protein [uncultured Marinifilum sp.]